METQRIFLAIALSLAILLGYQHFFAPVPPPLPPPSETSGTTQQSAGPGMGETGASLPVAAGILPATETGGTARRPSRDIPVETSLFTALFSETGGMVKSFQLKKFRESAGRDSEAKQLVQTGAEDGLPLDFSWGIEPGSASSPVYETESDKLFLAPDGKAELVMRGSQGGLAIVRTLRFDDQRYVLELSVDVHNTTDNALQGAPYLTLVNRPFAKTNPFIFNGPAVFLDEALQEIDTKDLKKGSLSVTGRVDWAGYEDNYFLCGIVPHTGERHTAHFSLAGEDKVTTVLAGAADLLQPGGSRQYSYTVYFGPKDLSLLKAVGHNLDRSVDFGWFDFMAKPTLYLLKFFHSYVGNYGLAIILVTLLIKILFWPIAQKGMKSMKTMQKLAPKMAKIREKYKDDKQRQQQEMVKLYQTYKVNPVGGCLPMLAQIPVFFALYKVLLQTIELRHAPFMLWITDLSAPDRLFIGFDIPFLGGIPVLTLLMGASMFLQQKMTPATGDPMQQKIMMFLPVVFTFMFLNFASGLVLYWFVNNLLSIGQQYLINRQVD
jgi:YidC/Oxa1 family membrane protein insertase